MMNRRMFLKGAAMTAVSALAASCAQPTPQVIEKEVPVERVVKETVVVEKEVAVEKVVKQTVLVQKEIAIEKVVTATPMPVKFKEAPMLAELVAQGKLPPVEERLPLNPCVWPGVDGVGQYGGTIRRGFRGVSDGNGPDKMTGNSFAWFSTDLSEMWPDIAESWELSGDAKTWTLNLRKGMKWSDGHPFTTEAFKYRWDKVTMNDDLTPNKPGVLKSGSPAEMCEASFPDDYTAVFHFPTPNPLLVYALRGSFGNFAQPGHYLQQFHPEFTPVATLEAKAKELGLSTWQQLYGDRASWRTNPEVPATCVWTYQNPLASELMIMERNPYFHQVDVEGNQLPYFDRVTHRMYSTADVFNMWIVNGEIDFQRRGVSLANYTLYKESEEKSDYKVYMCITGSHNGLNPNMTSKNPLIRELFSNRDVRIALNLAINRDEINELVYDGLKVPRQYSPISLSPQYYEPAATVAIEFDPDRASQLLDAAGYDQRDAEGYRMWKDGSGPLGFVIEGTTEAGQPDEDAVQMVVKYFNDVGVKAQYKYVERSLYTEHFQANEVDCAYWGGDRTVLPIVEPWIFIGQMIDRPWACAYGLYLRNNDDPNGEIPPDDHFVSKLWDIWYNQIAITTDIKRQNELFRQILDIWAEEVPMICMLGESPSPVIVKNGHKGYPDGAPSDNTNKDEHTYNNATYYWEDPENHM